MRRNLHYTQRVYSCLCVSLLQEIVSHSLREIIDTLPYISRSGCQRRLLPHETDPHPELEEVLTDVDVKEATSEEDVGPYLTP